MIVTAALCANCMGNCFCQAPCTLPLSREYSSYHYCTLCYIFVVWGGIALQAVWWVHALPIILRFWIVQIDILLMYRYLQTPMEKVNCRTHSEKMVPYVNCSSRCGKKSSAKCRLYVAQPNGANNSVCLIPKKHPNNCARSLPCQD